MNHSTKSFLFTLAYVGVSSYLTYAALSAWNSGGAQPDSTIWHTGFLGLVFLLSAILVLWGGNELGVRLGYHRRLGWGKRFVAHHFPVNDADRAGSS